MDQFTRICIFFKSILCGSAGGACSDSIGKLRLKIVSE